MTLPDQPETRALDAAQAINKQAVQLWWNAHYDGVRAGLEAAAVIAEQAANAISNNYTLESAARIVGAYTLTQLRDQLRLVALQPQPEPPA